MSQASSPYRNELDALRERKTLLERELADIRAQTARLDELRGRQAALEGEIEEVAAKIGTTPTRRLPMLDRVSVASPCSASWDEMAGDARVRYCTSCEKNVYNLSAMSREDAERLLEERIGNELCVRYYQRADGTVMTEDCPVGVRRKRRKKIALAAVGAGAMALAATTAFATTTCRMGKPARMGEARMAEPVAFDPPAPTAVPADTSAIVGQWAGPPMTPTAEPPAPTQVRPVRMGRPALKR